jgi:hypothetical protein
VSRACGNLVDPVTEGRLGFCLEACLIVATPTLAMRAHGTVSKELHERFLDRASILEGKLPP